MLHFHFVFSFVLCGVHRYAGGNGPGVEKIGRVSHSGI